jgi:hypothetical protein
MMARRRLRRIQARDLAAPRRRGAPPDTQSGAARHERESLHSPIAQHQRFDDDRAPERTSVGPAAPRLSGEPPFDGGGTQIAMRPSPCNLLWHIEQRHVTVHNILSRVIVAICASIPADDHPRLVQHGQRVAFRLQALCDVQPCAAFHQCPPSPRSNFFRAAISRRRALPFRYRYGGPARLRVARRRKLAVEIGRPAGRHQIRLCIAGYRSHCHPIAGRHCLFRAHGLLQKTLAATVLHRRPRCRCASEHWPITARMLAGVRTERLPSRYCG